MAKDSRLHVANRPREACVSAAPGRLEQRGAHRGEHLPIRAKRIEVAFGNAATQMPIDVLQIFRRGRVDVPRKVEIKVVLRIGDLTEWHQSRVTRHFHLLREGIDDAVNILRAQAVLVAVFDEAFARVDHEHPRAGGRVLLVEHQNAGGNAGAVKQIRGQTDNAFQDARAHELFTNYPFRVATKEHTVRQNARALAGAFERTDNVQQERVVALFGRRYAPRKTLPRVALRREPNAPRLHGKRWVGHHVVVATQLLPIEESRIGQRVPWPNVGRGEIVQDHVHARETGGGAVHLLPLKRDLLARLRRHLEQKRARPTGGVVHRRGGQRVMRADADHLRNDATHFGRRVELPFALATFGGEMPHEILVRVTKQIVLFGPVLREIQLRLLENRNKV